MVDKLESCKNIAYIRKNISIICKKIAQSRIESGQTQKDVSEWLGMSLRTYLELEKGKCTIENLCLVCDKFSIELNLNFKTN